jgi:hypothetical protein
VHAEERERRVGHRVDEAVDKGGRLGHEGVVAPAERHDARIRRSSGHPRQAVGIDTAAGDDSVGYEKGVRRVQADRGAVRRPDLLNGAGGVDRRAAVHDLLRHRPRDVAKVDDSGGGGMQGPHPAHGRLYLVELVLVEQPHLRHAVLRRAREELVQTRNLRLVGGDDDLAAAIVRNAVLVAVGVERAASIHAELRLQGSGGVVDAGMDDAAVVTRLVGGDASFLLEDCDADPGIAAERLARHGQSEDPGSDDGEVRGPDLPAHRTPMGYLVVRIRR